MTKIVDQYWNKTGNQESWPDFIKRAVKDSPVGKVAVGMVSFPAVVCAQMVVQNIREEIGRDALNMGFHTFKNLYNKIIELPSQPMDTLMNRTIQPIGAQLFFGEFFQSYLMDKKLSSLLNKFHTNYGELPSTTGGKCLRVVLASLAYATWSQSGIQDTPRLINDFVLGVFANGFREMTGSNLPGIGVYLVNSHLNSLAN